MPNSAAPNFLLGPGIWASIPGPVHHELLNCYTLRARGLLIRLQVCIPDLDRLHLIVEAAMETRLLYFAAALSEPTTDDLDGYFDHFVVCSVLGISDFNEAQYEN